MQDFSVRIKKSVVGDIISFSKNSYPNEFFAFLEGKRESNGIVVSNLAYHPFDSGEDSAATIFHLGTHTQGFVGSVHSHPSGSSEPSDEDLETFNKDGVVHLIISRPFSKERLRCFGPDGKELGFEIV